MSASETGALPPAQLTFVAYTRAALGVLAPQHRRRLWQVVSLISALALLDLAALFVVLGLTLTAGRAQTRGARIEALDLPAPIEFFARISGVDSVGGLVGSLAALALVLFVGKAVLAAFGLRRTLRFLAHREADLTHNLAQRLMAAPLSFHLPRRAMDLTTDITVGAECLVMKCIAPACLMCAEVVLVMLIGAGLVALAPVVAIGSLVYFAVVLFFLNRVIGRRAGAAGEADGTSTRQGMLLLQWAFGGFREVVTRGAQGFFTDMVREVRDRGAEGRASTTYLMLLPRYVLEASLVIGMALIYAIQLPFGTATEAFTGLVLFSVAGFRLLPSLQRLQVNYALAKGGQTFGERCLALNDELPPLSKLRSTSPSKTVPLTLETGVRFEGLSFRYEGAECNALTDLNVCFERGKTTALVGPSGSGKTTTVDVLLGLLTPSLGRVLIDDIPLQQCTAEWRRSVGYVPQSVFLMPVSVRDNITLGIKQDHAGSRGGDVAIWAALEKASLASSIRALPNGLDHVLGDTGAGLSGGQRQRLGIARAVYREPTVLVLDEATSALDVETEAEITYTLEQLDAALTKVVVAHRLSTVRLADHAIYIRDGRVAAQGTFDQISAAVPEFARQVELSGLGRGLS